MTESAVEIEGVPNLSLSDGQRSAIQCFLLSWVSEKQVGLEGLLEGLLGTFRLPNFEGTAVDVQPPTIQLNGAITTSLEDSEREETGTVVVYPFKRNFPKDERADFGSFAYTATLGLRYVTFDSTKDPLEQPRQGVISTEFHFCLDLLKLAGQGLRAWLRKEGLPHGFDDAKARLAKRIGCQASPTAVSVGDLAVWLVKELFELAAINNRAAVPAYLNGLLSEQDGRIKTIWQVLDAISFTPTAVPQRRDAMCNLQAKSIGAGLPVSHRWSWDDNDNKGTLLVNFSIPNPDLGHPIEDSYKFSITPDNVKNLGETLRNYLDKTTSLVESSQDLTGSKDPFQLLNELALNLLTEVDAGDFCEGIKGFLTNVANINTTGRLWNPGFDDGSAKLKLKVAPSNETPTIYSLKFKPVIDKPFADWCIALREGLRVAAAS